MASDAGQTTGAGSADYVWAGCTPAATVGEQSGAESELEAVLGRFFGSVRINSDRYNRDIGNITREVIDRLAGSGAQLEITIDIQAIKKEGFTESEVRTLSENARVLKFDPDSGFEQD